MSQDRDFLEYLVKELVEYPDDVKIKRSVDELGVLLELDVNPEDMGKIIGRKGNTAKSIRTLLRVIGMKNNARVNLRIQEPEGSDFKGVRHNENDLPESVEAEGTSDEE